MNAKNLAIGSLTVGLLALLALGASCPPRSPAPPAQHVAPFVRGYIAAAVPVRAQATATADLRRFHDVFLPRVEVYLVDLLTETARPSASTDLSGRFTLPAPPGRYRLCWKAEGFPPGCRQQLVGVAATPVHLSTVRIPLPEGRDTRIAFGRVTLSDGSSFRFLEPYADLNVFGSVLLLDESRRPLFEALVNNFGEYLVPNVPVKKDLFLVARVEGGELVQPLRAEANLAGAAVHRIDLAFANAPPSLAPLVPRHASGEPVQVAQPGETLRLAVVADDPDGDPLDIRWLPGPMTGSLSSDSGAAVDWTIPNAPGLYSVTVIASDGKGGRVKRLVSVRSDPRGVLFSGTVYSSAGGIVAGATVTVNGEPAKTDTAGFFRLHARVADRYVLTRTARRRGRAPRGAPADRPRRACRPGRPPGRAPAPAPRSASTRTPRCPRTRQEPPRGPGPRSPGRRRPAARHGGGASRSQSAPRAGRRHVQPGAGSRSSPIR